MTDFGLIFVLLLPIVAYMYANVGHGGASAYLAVLVLAGISPEFLRPAAWIMNLFVAGGAFYAFYLAGHFKSRLLMPFLISSVPMAFFTGSLDIGPLLFKLLLGTCLLIAALRVWCVFNFLLSPQQDIKDPSFPGALVAGSGIGAVAGMIGIGGGILLSPLIILMGWGSIKESAGVAAAFIFINSLAGLTGHFLINEINLHPHLPLWILLVVTGGWIGARQGSFVLTPMAVQRMLGVVMVIAAFKLFLL